MTMIKAYTDLEQSRELAKFLQHDSADMFYSDIFTDEKHKYNFHYLETYGFKTFKDTKLKESKHLSFIPCWSLAALLGVLPEGTRLLKSETDATYHCDCPKGNIDKWFDNPIDAAFELILKLHEQKLWNNI